ncbi:SH3 domain-containing protein [Leptospira mtsangambouensis]|uniref:SH3 domain-containing protein n=1 Tax=Leptospira mtsangambouensis TaxID=2484912 RepID=UPI001EECCF4F|nr:SH3 domain-containing protein [Leptospira mtsangambouensis]MCG6142785.1 SH3 domain-containing protein [Leptospira mtsangambouensis]
MKQICNVIFSITVLLITAQNIEGEERFIVNAKSGLNLRESPRINGKIVVSIPYKQPVTIIEKTTLSESIEGIQGNWLKIRWFTNEGYIFGGFLKKFENFEKDSTVSEIKLIMDAHLYVSDKKNIEISWIESPFPIQNKQIISIFPLYKPMQKLFQIQVKKSTKEISNDTGDATLNKGFNVTKENLYTRYIIEHEEINIPYLVNIKNPERNPDYPSDVIVIYPPVQYVKCVTKNKIKIIPKNELLKDLSYALDLDNDQIEDLLMFKGDDGSFASGYIKKNKHWILMYSFSGKPELDKTEYQCN